MKFFVAFAALIAVAVAINRPLVSDDDGIAAIIAAIQSPSTDPATAHLLQQQLEQILGSVFKPEPVHVGPEIIDGNHPISVGPVIVDQPILLPEIVSPEIVAPEIVAPEIAAPAPESQRAPLVQIIVNVQQEQQVGGPAPGVVAHPVEVPVTQPELVNVVDQAPELVNVVDQAPELVNVVDQAPELVNVVDQIPETVQILPILLPNPVNVPDTLN